MSLFVAPAVNHLPRSLLCAIVIGFTSAVAYNRFVLKQRGADQIPSVASVKAAGALTKDVVIVGGIVRRSSLRSP